MAQWPVRTGAQGSAFALLLVLVCWAGLALGRLAAPPPVRPLRLLLRALLFELLQMLLRVSIPRVLLQARPPRLQGHPVQPPAPPQPWTATRSPRGALSLAV